MNTSDEDLCTESWQYGREGLELAIATLEKVLKCYESENIALLKNEQKVVAILYMLLIFVHVST